MPNYVMGSIAVKGDQKSIAAFKRVAENTVGHEVLCLHAEKFLPTPEGLSSAERVGWQQQHWGARGGLYSPELTNEGDSWLNYVFMTAWSSVEPLIQEMSRLFPSLSIEYVCDDENACDDEPGERTTINFLNGVELGSTTEPLPEA